MTNPQGNFVWYELMTTDAESARAFYRSVAGIEIDPAPTGDSDMDYRMISAPDGLMGGLLALTDEMLESGAHPGWYGYIGVDDVDVSVAALEQAGGTVHMPAHTMEGVGRMAMVADPQGAPFYLMRGASEQGSAAYRTMEPGHVAWNELVTTDQKAAFGFYSDLVGWAKGETMDMGPMGTYQMFDQGGKSIGAMQNRMSEEQPPAWLFYIAVADFNAAHKAIAPAGGSVMHGDQEIPGGDYITIGMDPQGALFAIVGPKKG